MCRNFRSIEWHQKTYHKVSLCTVSDHLYSIQRYGHCFNAIKSRDFIPLVFSSNNSIVAPDLRGKLLWHRRKFYILSVVNGNFTKRITKETYAGIVYAFCKCILSLTPLSPNKKRLQPGLSERAQGKWRVRKYRDVSYSKAQHSQCTVHHKSIWRVQFFHVKYRYRFRF
jgi:hypothetical protein